ncbi:hypothetical protein PoB_002238000 [Plakobranchus ocellatus]|uniref:Uncharacterized protein n=1 Tax=Plakobranchus ocellatus TaxID=259542 RepID=A0AAV3ZMU4_9GAST|nr:hypothetical protein PoB_002238000 [Plakobranchus ocellatus]
MAPGPTSVHGIAVCLTSQRLATGLSGPAEEFSECCGLLSKRRPRVYNKERSNNKERLIQQEVPRNVTRDNSQFYWTLFLESRHQPLLGNSVLALFDHDPLPSNVGNPFVPVT